MLKLGLLGKDIQHSRSQFIYEEILQKKIEYRLLDFGSSSEIPPLATLFSDLAGLSITSPYKQQFKEDKELKTLFTKFPAVNCIKKIDSGCFEGTNTDYLAVKEILSSLMTCHERLNVIVLGNGVMAQITKIALEELSVSFRSYSRNSEIADLNTLDYSFLDKKDTKPLVINCCSRDFIFKTDIPRETIFWDHNYGLAPHQEHLSRICDYRDGLELLRLQALHALNFWGIIDIKALE